MNSRKNPIVKGVAKTRGRPIVEVNTPVFDSEAKEAAWWEANRADVIDMVVRYGARSPSSKTRPISIRVAESDLAIARALAEKRQLPYQSLLKDLLHDALAHAAQPALANGARPARKRQLVVKGGD
jgi:predicted DNA binding CopG/RHH family protein